MATVQAPVPVPTQVPTVPMVQPTGVKKPMNKKTMMLIGGILLTIIGLIMVFRKNNQKPSIEIKPANGDAKKVDAIKNDLKKIEKTIMGFKVKEGVSPIMDSLTTSSAEVQNFVQNEVCAIMNHEDTIKEFEDTFVWSHPLPCKGKEFSVEAGMDMMKENIGKMKDIAEKMSPEMKKLVLSLIEKTENTLVNLEKQACSDGKTEVKKEDVLKIIRELRLSICGHVERKTSKKEAKNKIRTVMNLIPFPSMFGGLPIARLQDEVDEDIEAVEEPEGKTFRDERIINEDGIEVPKHRGPPLVAAKGV